MTELERTGSDWRARWASRENKRRWRAYEDAVEAWCLRGIRLLRLRAAAENVPVEVPTGLPVALAEGEMAVAVQPRAELVEVEADRHVDLPTPELAVVPVRRTKRARRLPHGLRVAAVGTAVITDRRVILLGREEDHEWTFPLLSGLAHHPAAPITLLHTFDGGPLAGLRVPVEAAAGFRLRLTMAYADFIGQRRVVLARLDDAVAANRRSRPPLPVVATTEQAPARARFAHRAIIAAAVALIALPAYVLTADSRGPDRPPGTFDGAAPDAPLHTALPEPDTGTDPTDAPTTASPTTVPDGAAGGPLRSPVDPDAPGSSVDRDAPRPSAPSPRPAPQAPPPPMGNPGPVRPTPAPPTAPAGPPVPIPTNGCGAPENPYGYNYCGGDLVHEPAAGVCSYFTCVDGFWAGKGYLTVCEDGRVGRVGGRTGRCPDRTGRKQPVYVYRPAASPLVS